MSYVYGCLGNSGGKVGDALNASALNVVCLSKQFYNSRIIPT